MPEAPQAAAAAPAQAPVQAPAPSSQGGALPALPPRVREALSTPQAAAPQRAVAAPPNAAPPNAALPSATQSNAAPPSNVQAPARPTPPPAAPPTTADGATTWKTWFNDWPESIPRRGIVVNSLDEAMPFKGFMVRGDTVLLERTNPDTLGARFLLVPFSEIAVVKFVDPLKQAVFESAGFKGQLAG